MKEPGGLLRSARREAAGIPDIEFLDDFTWYQDEKVWILRCRISIESSSDFVPPTSEWFLLIPEDYPKGEIKVMPSKIGGIEATFPHQSLNNDGPEKVPWREGKLCLEYPTHVLGNDWDDQERHSAERQLHWVMSRAIEWVRRASKNNLLAPGDFFELPVLPLRTDSSPRQQRFTVAFSEDELSFQNWRTTDDNSGMVDLVSSNYCKLYKGTVSFELHHKGKVINTPFSDSDAFSSQSPTPGLWIRLQELPIVAPWEFPRDWGQIKKCLSHDTWQNFLHLLRSPICSIRQGKQTYLLLGAPIPEKIGETPTRIHWLSIKLPQPNKKDHKRWKRSKYTFWKCYEQECLSDARAIEWVETENWAPDQISTRGRFPAPLNDMSVVVIGLGALGAPVAELLARAGIRKMLLIDNDNLVIGNLVRHTLTMKDMCINKAKALRERLTKISPNLTVLAFQRCFEDITDDREALRIFRDADIVIDCTSDNDVLDELVHNDNKLGQILLSCSVNYGAGRFILYSGTNETFTPSQFKKEIEPFLAEDHKKYSENDCPRKGVGCWHPVFPARADDFSIFAGLILKHIEKLACNENKPWGTIIYEQANGEDFYCGLKRIYPKETD